MKILLVEDNDIDAFVADHMLSNACEEDCMITRFPNGKEAVEHLMNQDITTPFVVVLDMNMPIMDGLEFMQEISKNDLLKEVKITVLTSSAEERDITSFQNFGVNRYYMKPLTVETSMEILDYARID